MADSPVLWILGAGASKHLDLPLLAEFPQFIAAVASHRDNQGDADRPGREASWVTLRRLAEHGGDIERLLGIYAIGTAEGDQARECIRWCFQKRHAAVMKKRDTSYKYAAYAYMLCCVQPADRIVTFNYDLAIERTIKNADRADAEHLKQPRIPYECLAHLKKLKYELSGVQASSGGGIGPPFRLVKVHGSVNWKLRNGRIEVRSLDEEAAVPFLVYPDPAKGELTEGPGRNLADSAVACLPDARAVVIAGYSMPPSDRVAHPFISELSERIADLPTHIVSPSPPDSLIDFTSKSPKITSWCTSYERVFSATGVQRFSQQLGRLAALNVE